MAYHIRLVNNCNKQKKIWMDFQNRPLQAQAQVTLKKVRHALIIMCITACNQHALIIMCNQHHALICASPHGLAPVLNVALQCVRSYNGPWRQWPSWLLKTQGMLGVEIERKKETNSENIGWDSTRRFWTLFGHSDQFGNRSFKSECVKIYTCKYRVVSRLTRVEQSIKYMCYCE